MDIDEVNVVATRIGKDWKSVGYALRLSHAVLDQIDADCPSGSGRLQDKVEVMLRKWLSHRAQKATVSRLAKALFINYEFDAIKVIRPEQQ